MNIFQGLEILIKGLWNGDISFFDFEVMLLFFFIGLSIFVFWYLHKKGY